MESNPSVLLKEKKGRYRLHHCLDLFSHLWMAEDRLTRREVVIKTADSTDEVNRLQREFQILTDLHHPNLPVIHDLWIDGDQGYLILEVIEGETLASRIQAQLPWSSDEFFSVLFQLILALDYLERKGIVHRDIKPQNILIGKRKANLPHVKLIDFGLALHGDEIFLQASSAPAGTIQYAAPETIKKISLDHRSDIYSLGVVGYEWITGHNPFEAGDLVQTVVRQIEVQPPEPVSRFDFIPPEFGRIILKCIQKNPDLRYQNISELWTDLLSIPEIRKHAESFSFEAYLNEGLFADEETIRIIVQSIQQARQQEQLTTIRLTAEDFVNVPAWIQTLKRRLTIGGARVFDVLADRNQPEWHYLSELAKALSMPNVIEDASENTEEQFFSNDNPDEWITLMSALAGANRGTVWLIGHSFYLSPKEKSFWRELKKNKERIPLVCVEITPPGTESLADSSDAVLTLPGFTHDHIGAYLRHLLFDIPAETECLDYLSRVAGSDPAMAKETVRYWIHQKKWKFNGQHYVCVCSDADAVPVSLPLMIEVRLAQLNDDEQHRLKKLSLYPAEWSPEAVRIAWDNHPDPELIRSLEKAGFIRRSGNRIGINGSVLQDLLYQSIPAEERKFAHQQLAEKLEKINPEENASQIAFHWFNAGFPDRALGYFIHAGKTFQMSGQWAMAKQMYEAAEMILQDRSSYPDEKLQILECLIQIYDFLGEREHQRQTLERFGDIARKTTPEWHLRFYLAQANYYERISDFARMEQTLIEAGELAERHQIPVRYRVYRLLGKSYYQRARWQDALIQYQKALRVMPEETEPALRNEIFNGMGTIQATLGYDQDAQRTFTQAVIIAQQTGDVRAEVNALMNLGYLAHRLHREEEALGYYQKVEERIQTLRNPKFEQRLLQYRGISYRNLHQLEQALKCFERAAVISENLKDRQTLGKSFAEQAFIYQWLGDIPRALQLIEKSLSIAEELQNRKDQIARYLRKTDLLIDQGNLEEASASLQQAYADNEILSDPEWRIYAAWVSARLQYRKALQQNDISVPDPDFLREPIETCEKQGFRSLQVLLLDLQSSIQEYLNKPDKALETAQKAIQILQEYPVSEFDLLPVWLHVFRLLQKNKAPQDVCRQVMDQAVQKIVATEKQFSRSVLREKYHNKPVVQEILQAHSVFNDEQRQFQMRSYTVMHDIVQTINSELDPETVFERVLDEALRHTGADRGVILLKKEDSEELEVQAARHIHPEEWMDVAQISQSVVRDVVASGQPVVTADAQQDERFRERRSVAAYHIRSVMCVPLKIRDQLVGAVYVDKQFDADYFNRANVEFLEFFAHLAAIAVENARRYGRIRDEKTSLEKANIDLRLLAEEKYIVHRIVGRSKPMREVIRLIELAATHEAPVLIEGESGTGKELVARAIHFNSPRKSHPFVAVDCGALQENLLESELFGYKKGAFTGAHADKKGLFEEADGGTLLMDEIANTTLNFQAKLLRVLQEGEIRRLGDTKTRKLNVRIIAATNQILSEEVRRSTFREDLFYRLNVFRIALPPLRERREDIPLMIRHFVDHFNVLHKKSVQTISPALLDRLQRYDWPGNVREMENIIQRMVILANDNSLTLSLLPEELRESAPLEVNSEETPFLNNLQELEAYLYAVEKNFWIQILKQSEGNKSKAAERLGIKRTTLNDRLKKFGLL